MDVNKQNKYLQIFKYLLEFSKIRSRPVRNIENAKTNYTDILWMSDFPIIKLVECIVHDNFSTDNDFWVKIYNPTEPEKPIFPSPPQKLVEWIDSETLLNKDNFPSLLERIDNDEDETKSLEEDTQIKSQFENYCENKWIFDSEEYWKKIETYEKDFSEYERVNNLYKKLFSIYNKSQQLGEEYELILGIGLINFRENEDTPHIFRHILISKAEINFEYSKRDSKLIVKQSLSDGLQIETDVIIDLFDQFESNDIIEAEKKSIEFINDKELTNPFDENIHDVLQLLAERIKPGDGSYKDILVRPKDIPTKETIFFSPALILRKRNTRSYTALYEKIISDIEEDNGLKIPTLDNLIEIEGLESNFSNDTTDDNKFKEIEPIYFPKKYNDEQIEIIYKSRRNNKVLVQGPPGTGKSHTIANLICHLLANGKKVLVTAYTKRALEVLKDKLPEEFKNLTVNFLSGDSSSIHDLEASVNGINDKLSNTDIKSLRAEIEKSEVELSHLKEGKATDTNELLKIKERSSRKVEINSNYIGTLTEIAEQLEKEKDTYAWYKDNYYDINNSEIDQKIHTYYSLFDQYLKIDTSIFSNKLPIIEKLFEMNDFRRFHKLVQKKNDVDLSTENSISVLRNEWELLHEYLTKLKSVFEKIGANPHPFKKVIVSDTLINQKRHWENKTNSTKEILSNIKKYNLHKIDRDIEIKYPKEKSFKTLKNDAKILIKYLESGKSLSGLRIKIKPILPKEIKERLYFINDVLVNNSPCDSKDKLIHILDNIRINQYFEELTNIWNNIDKSSKLFNSKFIFYEQLYQETITLFEDIISAQKIISSIKTISNINIDNFSLINLKQILKSVSYSQMLDQIEIFEQKRSLITKYLSDNQLYHIKTEITDALNTLNINSYESLLKQLEKLKSRFIKFESFKNLDNELTNITPILIKEINNGSFSKSNIDHLLNAISFRHANSEINKLLSEDYEANLIEKLKSYDSIEEKLISQIASNKAWSFVLDNLNKNKSLRQHLEAWVQAVRKIGKTGRGKRALKFRKIAQEQMEYCKSSIPCWIMPLYKVTETIKPEKFIYDYVIIDEASQLGPDAIFLLYISKNIIIVGDDKQTSPEYIGVDANKMGPFINKHLEGIPFKDFYGTEYSIFDHAKRFCDGIIILREHFRCMPEIIEFSNKLFYSPDGKGLYPLKQYSENRLKPLRNVYCQNGYTEGYRQNISNEPEAQAIVNKIAEIIKDERYSKKTIGVICLQGNSQGALIENRLVRKIGEKEYKERKIVCGNSASFQGDERDIIFLSLVTASNHKRNALARPEDERRYNVAVSRAVEQIWLFHSILIDDLSNPNDLRYKLLNHFINYKPFIPPIRSEIKRTLGNQPKPFDSWFEVDVFNDIVSKGYNVIPQYEVAKGKYRIDLVPIFPDGTKMAIECDGDKWHGAEQYQKDFMRQKVLERCGWQFFRIRGGEYYLDRIKAMAPLWDIFDEKQTIYNEANKVSDEESQKEDLNNEEIGKEDIDDSLDSTEYINKIKISNLDSLFNQDEFLLFTNQFNVYKTRNISFTNLQQIIADVDLEDREKIIYITGTSNYSGYMLFGFENGKVAKIYMHSYKTLTQRKRLKNAYNNISKLVFIKYIETDIDLVVISSIHKVIVFNTVLINPKESKGSQGHQVIKLKDNSLIRGIKEISLVTFTNIDYYRKNIPAVGNYLLPQDKL